MNKRQMIYIALIAVFLIVFGVSTFYVISYFSESKEQQDQFNELANIVADIQAQNPTTAPTTGSTDETTGEETEPSTDENGETIAPTEPVLEMLPEYAALYEMNPHTVGWIKIEGTVINYPVMQVPDQMDYYLKRNFNGEKSSRGCIYVREQCDVFEPSDNLTIYGHNMNDGSMFHALKNYTYQSYWEANNLITFDTLYERHTYQIFAVFKTTATVGEGFSYHLFMDAKDEAEFDEYVATCKELALYDTDITPVFGDKLITLSTCEYTRYNGRLVVVAVRID